MCSLYITLVLLLHFGLNGDGNDKFPQDFDSDKGGENLFNSQNSEQARKIFIAKQYLDQLDVATKETWIDPYDMLNYQASSHAFNEAGLEKNAVEGKYQKEIQVAAADSELPKNTQFPNVLSSPPDGREILGTNAAKDEDLAEYDYVYLNRWLKIFLKKVNPKPDMKMEEIRFFQFAVKNQELFTLQNMLDFKSQDVSTVDKIISKSVADVYIFSSENSWWLTTTEFVTSDKFLFIGAIILCLIILFNLYHCFLNHPIRTFLIILFLTSFIMSWYSLYQKKVAEKYATLDSINYATECRKENLGYVNYFSVLIKNVFFNLGDDCEKYYKAQMVDPVFSVSPITAISETLANMVFQPLGPMGNHLNAFMKGFFSGIPFIAIFPGIVFSLLVLLIICRYKIRLPFFLASLEPSTHTHDSNRIDDILQNEADRNNRYPIIQMSKLYIHMVKDNESVETNQLQLHDLSHGESNKMIEFNTEESTTLSQNAEKSTTFSQNAEESTTFSQHKISSKSKNEMTINAKEFVINSSGDNADVIKGNKTGNCLLNSNECSDSLIETLEPNKSLDEKFIKHDRLNE